MSTFLSLHCQDHLQARKEFRQEPVTLCLDPEHTLRTVRNKFLLLYPICGILLLAAHADINMLIRTILYPVLEF